MRSMIGLSALLLAMLPVSAAGQASGFEAACAAVESAASGPCLVAAQALQSAQAPLGMLLTGGNPTIGAASTGGLRMGILPRVSATGKVNLVGTRIPDLRSARLTPTDGTEFGDVVLAAPALSGTVTVGLLRGMDLAPTIGGLGAVDLLAAATWLPLEALGSDQFRSGSATSSWGAGVRVGLLRESFTMPGASVSVMHHRLGEIAYGEICPAGVQTSSESGPGYRLEQGECVAAGGAGDLGDLGEFSADLRVWSGRAVVSKHLLGLGLAAGLGYDRYSSDVEVGARAPEYAFGGPLREYVRVTDVDLSQSRLSAFVNGSLSLLVATIAVEGGWMQGGDAVGGYPASVSDFDPGTGTFFGSVGLRLAL